MLSEKERQNGRCDQKSEGKYEKGGVIFHNLGGRVADSPQQSGDKKTAGGQTFHIYVLIHYHLLLDSIHQKISILYTIFRKMERQEDFSDNTGG